MCAVASKGNNADAFSMYTLLPFDSSYGGMQSPLGFAFWPALQDVLLALLTFGGFACFCM